MSANPEYVSQPEEFASNRIRNRLARYAVGAEVFIGTPIGAGILSHVAWNAVDFSTGSEVPGVVRAVSASVLGAGALYGLLKSSSSA